MAIVPTRNSEVLELFFMMHAFFHNMYMYKLTRCFINMNCDEIKEIVCSGLFYSGLFCFFKYQFLI